MRNLTGVRHQPAGQGFTLIELLLATVLLMLLVGASVFSYSSLQRGAALDEGVTQFEALLRYAQSQAASSGRKVQVVFEEAVTEDLAVALGNVRVVWEPDPLGQPGEFVELATASSFVGHLVELVQIESVRHFEPGEPLPVNLSTTAEQKGTNSTATGEGELSDYQPPLVFYPDGSSDSAEITLAARDPEDTRRIKIRLVGITGAIQHKRVADETEPVETETEEKSSEKTVTRTTSLPASASESIPAVPAGSEQK